MNNPATVMSAVSEETPKTALTWWEKLTQPLPQQPPSQAVSRTLEARAKYQRVCTIPTFDKEHPHKIVTIAGTDYHVGPAGNLIRVHSKRRSNKA